MDLHQPPQPAPPAHAPPQHWTDRLQHFVNEYAWFIVRNIIGWILVLAAPALGLLLPGPGGLPIFLIGFALVTFPGKRRLTARVLRGRRFRIEDRAYTVLAAFVAIAIPGVAWWIIWSQYKDSIQILIEEYTPRKSVFILAPLLAILLTWLVTRISLRLLNGLLRLLPRFRRKFRPWMKRWGLKLLPPRKRSHGTEPAPAEDEILEISEKHRKRLRIGWARLKPWIWRLAAIAITVWIFEIMIRPLWHNWPAVRSQIGSVGAWSYLGRFLGASVMFAVFLLCFRALAWRAVLKGFGHKLPHFVAARIWATSEMARYLPGAIWQVVGRVYLAKPYGVPGSIISTSQILEICIFLLANSLIAGGCLLWFGQKMDPHARPWLITALALVPGLAMLVHPKIFYGVTNWVLKRVNKPPIVRRLRGTKLIKLLLWMILGLLWQSLAIYLLVDPVLHLKLAWWWVVAGAYCLAWAAGFLAFWAPGGIGVRELVFVTTMEVIIPPQVRHAYFRDPAAFAALLVLLGFLLRLWTVCGELMLLGTAYLLDLKGALNRPDAPGRRNLPPETAPPAPTTPLTPAPFASPAPSGNPTARAGGPSCNTTQPLRRTTQSTPAAGR
jgi:hypothetical protein